jgi:cell division protein FtsB
VRTLAEAAQAVDVLALRLGTRITASSVLIAAVIVILVGAQSLLTTLDGMERDIAALNKQLAVTNAGVKILGSTMGAVPASQRNLAAIITTVETKQASVAESARQVEAMAATTASLQKRVAAISTSTAQMRASLETAAASTEQLDATITQLDAGMDPLVAAQRRMFLGTAAMRGNLYGMNGSLGYVVRQLNYLAAPPGGGGFTVQADLPKETLPPLPGLSAQAAPLQVFPRGIWSVYSKDPAP